ncbi:MAB_1171c family putative transporter [Crossiella sp. CA198]|uniref:MAB_1171c family putative transporter n=1 Tax=Crossiella sp. CA198 TaxID=3455607 RepID=UPI003F8D2C0F
MSERCPDLDAVSLILPPLCALVSFIALLYKLRDLRRDRREPGLLALCATFAVLTVTYTLFIPVVWAWVDRVLGVPNIGGIINQGMVILLTMAQLSVVLRWSAPAEVAWPRIRYRLWLYSLVLAAMAVLYVLALATEPQDHEYVLALVRSPYYQVYLVLYLGAYTLGQADVMRLCWRYAKVAGRPWLRRGLRLAAASSALGLVYSAGRTGDLVAALFDYTGQWWEPVVQVCIGLAALLKVVGWTIPGWGPRLSVALGALDRRRALRELTPLWQALYRSAPDIALIDPLGGGQRQKLDFRLYRKVIEIRDGQLALRPYLDPAVAETARRIGTEAGLRGSELDVVVEAARLRVALRDQAEGYRPEHSGSVGSDGVGDLAEELSWLRQVSRAFSGSPVVAAVLAETSREHA